MPTRVGYTYKNRFRTEFVDPVAGYKTIDSWNRHNFDDFFFAPKGAIITGGGGGMGPGGVPVPAVTAPVLKLYVPNAIDGVVQSGVIMCGETKELKASLLNFVNNKYNLQGLMGEAGLDYRLLACYVRVKHGKKPTETLISIGPLGPWWKPLVDGIENFQPSPWRKFMNADDETDLYDLAISFKQLAGKLDQCEKKGVPVIPV